MSAAGSQESTMYGPRKRPPSGLLELVGICAVGREENVAGSPAMSGFTSPPVRLRLTRRKRRHRSDAHREWLRHRADRSLLRPMTPDGRQARP
jgi:hypothetical protein